MKYLLLITIMLLAGCNCDKDDLRWIQEHPKPIICRMSKSYNGLGEEHHNYTLIDAKGNVTIIYNFFGSLPDTINERVKN